MADSTVKIYGFVNDTAFYNRNFDPSSKTEQIDQGACCLVDKVSQMFGEPTFIRDLRSHRCTMPELVKVGAGWTSSSKIVGDVTLKELMTNDHTYLNGAMSIVYDGAQVTDEVKYTFTKTEQMKALFSYLEIVGHYVCFENDAERTGLDLATVVAMAAPYAEAAGNAVVSEEQTTDSKYVAVAKTQNIKILDTGRTEFSTNRIARKWVVVSYEGVAEDGTKIPIELHLWWGRDAFIEQYPLSTITDVIFPCKPECLYELLDNYKSVSAASSAISEYSSTKMNEVVKKNDHTGVYTFTTDYYAYPDTQPSNTFKLSFSCVYKGHVPTLEQVKTRLRAEVLAILPKHSEAEWRKKLPGIIADRQFFLLPIYDNIWTSYDESSNPKTHRWGIFDLTIFSNLIRKTLGTKYLEQSQYGQIVSPKYSQYPVLAIPHLENPETNRLISSLYQDYIGLQAGDTTDPEAPITQECASTQDFETHFNDSLADAAGVDESKFSELTDFPGLYWTHFTPIDGTTYYILAKKSYPTGLR